ncbi:HsdM family class I SAM-dependent methyltransferase [Paenalcaligenes suwonensis]|uniref:HsdM family class I SAM-dependent methyltransferase n=1 Tax=Paenalcaligenes suwonensis TaxID=1202713 RepID=UPI001409F98F|nr:N-6 DNA methylase [Paenalcaligenes suwonensis]NHC60015.1 N-6 DNA methylase [Paenalcaligenes suwonensis]
MNNSSTKLAKKLQLLLRLLSYTPKNGWVAAEHFGTAQAHRFALEQARESMDVKGAFCWLSGSGTSTISAPLVYIAIAADRVQAQAIHRKVWSQGLVPFLIVVTPNETLICEGFRYTSEQWQQTVYVISWEQVSEATKGEPTTTETIKTLTNLRADRLRSSVFWREHAIDVSGRVDQMLLSGLSSLSYNLLRGSGVASSLSHGAANGLIGKLLYLYFLVDRGVINHTWLMSRGHTDIDLSTAHVKWEMSSFWKLFDDLDSIFNGSIFPLSAIDRAEIDATHVHLAKAVLKHGAHLQPDGAVQLSFIDIDLSVLRVETLSAVYEQFLENVKSGERRRVGAYYTPPFLVDLVLDRVEDELPLKDGITVLDPAAGSGVFLVGVYRRILENSRLLKSSPLSLDQIRGLLVRNIFGVERNLDACHVAAFSLYLTMLDYVSPRDLSAIARSHEPQKLFPSLVGTNLLAMDFFSPAVRQSLPPIQCVVGNPPWQTVSKLESPMATEWVINHPNCPIGNDQAAEAFVWKSLREHLIENGVLGILIPSKSFVNPTAAKFRVSLQHETFVSGVINFSHLRHKLFAGAKHACAALFLRKRVPKPTDWVWVYTPLSISQPVSSKDAWPWTLIMDEAAIQQFRHHSLATNPRGWFEAFVLRPVDRQIHRFIGDSATHGSITFLGELCKTIGAKCKRGGDESDTGLSSELLNGGSLVESSVRAATQRSSQNCLKIDGLTDVSSKKEGLSLAQLARVKPNYKNQFSGNILLIPRNFRNIRFIEYPVAYTSSYLAVFFDKNTNQISVKEKQLLKALEKYLSSSVALYFVATIGRRWLMDRRNVEPTDIACLPVPLTSLDDGRIQQLLAYEGPELDEFILNEFKLDHDLRSAVQEFLHFRMGFQDGNVPIGALTPPKAVTLSSYSKIFQHNLDGLIDRKGAFKVAHQDSVEAGIGAIVAHYVDDGESPSHDVDLKLACQAAIDAKSQQGGSPFSDSLAITVDLSSSTIAIVKPLEYFRWTVDNAYADSHQAIRAFIQETT